MARHKKRPILVLNSSFEPIGVCEFNTAIRRILNGTVWSLSPSMTDFVQGPPDENGKRLSIPWPSIIVYKRYKAIDYEHIKPLDPVNATRMAILNRDNFTCAYCGEYGPELEHILPQSRGGTTTWLNCVAACRECNSRKGDRTPEEAGLKLLWHPYVPDQNKWVKQQEKVWKILEEGNIEFPEEDD